MLFQPPKWNGNNDDIRISLTNDTKQKPRLHSTRFPPRAAARSRRLWGEVCFQRLGGTNTFSVTALIRFFILSHSRDGSCRYFLPRPSNQCPTRILAVCIKVFIRYHLLTVCVLVPTRIISPILRERRSSNLLRKETRRSSRIWLISKSCIISKHSIQQRDIDKLGWWWAPAFYRASALYQWPRVMGAKLSICSCELRPFDLSSLFWSDSTQVTRMKTLAILLMQSGKSYPEHRKGYPSLSERTSFPLSFSV